MDHIWFEPHSLLIKSAFLILLVTLIVRERFATKAVPLSKKDQKPL